MPDDTAPNPDQVIAELRRELAHYKTALAESMEQQAATTEVLQVINASPGDLTPVFDAMLEKAMNLCEAAFGSLSRFNGERFYAVAWRGTPESARLPSSEGISPDRGSALERITLGEHIVHVPDLIDTEAYRSGVGSRIDFVGRTGARTAVWVALCKDEALVGVFVIYRTEVRPFTDKQIALLQNFAAQAVIAMENARLITETREALKQQTATAEVLGVINSNPGDLAPVFDAILEKAHALCGATYGSLQTYDGEFFRTVASRGLSDTLLELVREPFRPHPNSFEERLVRGDDFVHIPDVMPLGSLPDDPLSRTAVETAGLRTLLLLPLRKEAALVGYVASARPEVRPFSDREIALLRNFAAQAVIAIENARLITETREALEQQTATAEVLGVINSSPGDLAPVFNAILEKAMALCSAAVGELHTFDGERFRTAALRGGAAAYAAARTRTSLSGRPGTASGRILETKRTLHIADLKADEAYRIGEPTRRDSVDLGGIRTLLAAPLLKDDGVVGVLAIYRHEVQPFSEKQIALLQNFAAQAVIAIENARLLGELRERNDEIAKLNRGLEARVAEQVEELGRVGRLKRFLAPQLAELIVSQGDEKILESHRREIVVVFCDLRGYTAFTETAEPEEVLDFLREYHGALGPLVSQFEGTLDQFSGDGIMVFFNDPVPIPDPAERAVKMAMAMREAAGTLIVDWRERGRELGFGAGIAQGYATLGQIGFSERSGYTAIGTVCNVAARLCAEAKDGQILLGQRVNVALKGSVATEQVGALALKGLTQPVVAFNVPLAAVGPAFRVIEGGSPSD